jgi:hypothetical protein
MLGHLFHGWALERAGRGGDALSALRAAHQTMPAAQSAATWYARALFMTGARAEAEAIIERALATGLGELDPWRVFQRGDFRLWPALIKQLREAIR